MKRIFTFITVVVLALSLAACSSSSVAAITQSQEAQAANGTTASADTAGTTSTAAADSVTATQPANTAAVLTENKDTHDDAGDYTWDSAAVIPIELMGDTINVDSKNVTVDGSMVTITAAGTYSLSGSLTDGQILVDTDDDGVVRLILNGVALNSSTGSPLAVMNAEKVVIVLNEGTQNTVNDAASYVFPNADEDEPNAAVFSKSDLTIFGQGSLTVQANYNDGITSKDGLIIASGTITVNAVDDGIRGKDYLVIKDGTITVTAQGDGLKADNEEDAEKGYIAVEGGTLTINAGGDGMDAATDVIVSSGQLDITTAGGSASRITEDTSVKGIKGTVSVTIDGGSFKINSADDAIHSNGSIVVNAGDFVIASGDDGMHADATLVINDGVINVTQSYEGIESAAITINNGTIHVVASDDGINVAGGKDGSGTVNTGAGMQQGGMNPGGGTPPDGNSGTGGMNPGGGTPPVTTDGTGGTNTEPGGQPGGRRGGGGGGGGFGQDTFNSSASYTLNINGGYIYVEAAGDGIDVNGAITMTGGVVVVNGPTQQMNGALDYDFGFDISGGTLVAAGSSGMAQLPGATSSQNSVIIYFTAAQSAGTLVHIQDSQGADVLTFAPVKDFQSLVLSSASLKTGETYTVYLGGNADGSVTDGLYQGGSYSPGTQYTSFTVSSAATTVGSGGGGMGGARP